ncbi:sensor histidine kinase [Rhodovulum strictum]|uniref:histidine kinase n=1 Tax=Rhodovulum strictum TaxID=58314 RepID=A0A844BGV7_9RHOB|nr:HAMP domain-containing sensor histidine kinase [Rhodovulum strictum]MRH21819.1 HAMP domain-containing protein [Rhodovulum strictum]
MHRLLAPFASFKGRLAIGAGMIGLVAILSGALTLYGMGQVSQRIAESLNAERRIARYSVLSTQISAFVSISAEAVQAGLSPDERAARMETATRGLERTFALMRQDLGAAVAEARLRGLNEQSRRATQSIAIARMEALFNSTRDGLLSANTGEAQARAYLAGLSQTVESLLGSAVTDEMRMRDQIIAGIGELRRRLTLMALGISALAVGMFGTFYLGLVRPQMGRLDLARQAAQRIGRGEFDVALPENRADEIGRLFAETNRAARALAQRRDEVEAEWARLNDTIAARTEELRAANEALARTDEERRRFFADIGHELRTPLTVILLESELGLRGAGEAREGFETIHARAQRLHRRIDDMLRVARSETGRIELACEPCDPGRAAAEAIADIRTEIDAAGMKVEVTAEPGLLVLADPDWLRQLIAGLAQNAVRHAAAGGRLSVAVMAEDGAGVLRVTDNGPGVPADEIGRVFARFHRGAEGPRPAGFGIGLALAKWLVDQIGGEIALVSPVPAPLRLGTAPGTMAELRLPLIEE